MMAGLYTAVLTLGLYFAYELRFDFAVSLEFQQDRVEVLWFVVGINLIALVFVRQLDTTLSYFSVPDLKRIVFAMTATLVLMLSLRSLPMDLVQPPRGVLLINYILSVAGLCVLRLSGRLYRERFNQKNNSSDRRLRSNLAIIGAGDAGASLARDFLNTPARGFRPVLFFDDDELKHGKMLHGVLVAGNPEMIEDAVNRYQITKAVIAMPTASAKRVREIVQIMSAAGITVETLPAIEELASGKVRASRVRPVEITDLLGRDQVELEAEAIRDLIEGKVVMVTGAGGSIGRELCRQITSLNPRRLLLVEQSEGSLFYIERELSAGGEGSIVVPLVANILDKPRMRQIFIKFKPQVIFHAAAHKHVYMMERQPAEALHNNSIGTLRLAAMAIEYQAESFVLISTDKAINPTSVMGASKRLAELELQRSQSSGDHKTKLMAVRFGNVLGSSGSVIPIFKEQIAKGGPVTVTHRDVTRYFMTIPEAVGLVLQSTVQGEGGEIFVLDMGQPIKIIDLATQMIELSGYRLGEDIEIQFIGLKPGEKLFEELQHNTEEHQATRHPRIMQFVASPTESALNLEELVPSLHEMDIPAIKRKIRELVPEYTPHFD